jgi:hypothetical protein
VLGCEVDSSGSEYTPVTGCCEYGNEPSGSTKDEEFLELLSDCQLPKKGSLPKNGLNT